MVAHLLEFMTWEFSGYFSHGALKDKIDALGHVW